MAVTKVITTNANTYAVTDDGATVYLEAREPYLAGGIQGTADRWAGTTPAIRDFYDEIVTNPFCESARISQNGQKSTLSIQWSVSFTTGDTPEDDPAADSDTWSMRAIEIPTPLAAHPYFQVVYIPASGELIEDEIARCESAIKRGRSYVASGDYKDYVKRYYALRMAGVEEWIQYGVEITRRYKAFAQADLVAATAFAGTVLTIAAVGMPADLQAAVENLPKIDSYTNEDPDTYQLTRSAFEFVVQPPSISVSFQNGALVADIEATFVGLQQWSKVIYPEGTWDPQGETE